MSNLCLVQYCNDQFIFSSDMVPVCILSKGHGGGHQNGEFYWANKGVDLCGEKYYMNEHEKPSECTLSKDHGGRHQEGTFQWLLKPEVPEAARCLSMTSAGKCLLPIGHDGRHRSIDVKCGEPEYPPENLTYRPSDPTCASQAGTAAKINPMNVIENWQLDLYLGIAINSIYHGRLKEAAEYLNRKIEFEEKRNDFKGTTGIAHDVDYRP